MLTNSISFWFEVSGSLHHQDNHRMYQKQTDLCEASHLQSDQTNVMSKTTTKSLLKTMSSECLTFFLGWLTSSFMEAHLFRVFRRLQQKHQHKVIALTFPPLSLTSHVPLSPLPLQLSLHFNPPPLASLPWDQSSPSKGVSSFNHSWFLPSTSLPPSIIPSSLAHSHAPFISLQHPVEAPGATSLALIAVCIYHSHSLSLPIGISGDLNTGR